MEIRQLSLIEIVLNQKQICKFLAECIDTIQVDTIRVQEKYDKLLFHVRNGTGYVFGAMDSQQLCGFCWVYPYETEWGQELHIAYLAVDAEHRGRGLGKELVLFCEGFAKEKNIFSIGLNVAADNDKAKSLYLHCGMKPQTIYFRREI